MSCPCGNSTKNSAVVEGNAEPREPHHMANPVYSFNHFLGQTKLRLQDKAKHVVERTIRTFLWHEFMTLWAWLIESPFETRQVGFLIGFVLFLAGWCGSIVNAMNIQIAQALIYICVTLTGVTSMLMEYRHTVTGRSRYKSLLFFSLLSKKQR